MQESGEEGITDLEIEFPDQALQVTVEAKFDGWPRMAQLSRYARQMTRTIRGEKVLVALGVSPHAPDLQDMNSLDGGVTLRLMRWVDVLSVVDRVEGEAGDEKGSILEKLSNLIEEVIGMQSYDREVLIRDMDTQDDPSPSTLTTTSTLAKQANARSQTSYFSKWRAVGWLRGTASG